VDEEQVLAVISPIASTNGVRVLRQADGFAIARQLGGYRRVARGA
jgi:hypothetical protein